MKFSTKDSSVNVIRPTGTFTVTKTNYTLNILWSPVNSTGVTTLRITKNNNTTIDVVLPGNIGSVTYVPIILPFSCKSAAFVS